MKRVLAWATILLLAAISAKAQEPRDTTKYDMLEQSVATAHIQRTAVRRGAVVTTVAGSPLEKAGSAEDVLSRIPGMVKNGTSLEVAGRGAPQYYIDGRKVYDFEELRRLPSDEIRQIEVIQNPDAQYSADVRAVVRIKTVRRKGEGLSVDLLAKDRQLVAYPINYAEGTLGLNYRKKKLDLFANTNYWSGHSIRESILQQTTTLGGNTLYQDGSFITEWKGGGLNFDAGAAYELGENGSVGVRWYYSHTLSSNNLNTTVEDIFENNSIADRLSSVEDTRALGHPWTQRVNAYYNGTVGGTIIDINADIYSGKTFSAKTIEENSRDCEDALINVNTSNGDRLYAVKTVLSHKLWKGSITGGTEITTVARKEMYHIEPSVLPSTDIKIGETTAAAFAAYSFPIKDGEIGAGVRYEHVSFKRKDGSEDIYDRLYPSVSFSKKIKKVGLSAAYSAITRRPDFFQLSNAVSYYNRYTLQTGNPDLESEIQHTFSLGASYSWLTASCVYEHNKGHLIQWAEIYNDDYVILLDWRNHTSPTRFLTAIVSLQPTVGVWHPSWTLGVKKQWLDLGWMTMNRPIWFANINNAFVLPKSWQIDANLQTNSAGDIDVTYSSKPILNSDIGIQKSFLENKSLTVRLSYEDVFNSTQEDLSIYMNNYFLRQYNRFDTQKVVLTLRYKFNTTEGKYRGSGAGNDIRSRL
ncbi:MAG: TonB-dependent receptor [Bacteroidales bacterium]|nr:TonB-dependent receptor [Bacteroidales bacterium]